jgi:hypothetical protein
MNRALVLALFAILSTSIAAPAMSKETSEAVIQDFKRHQAKKHTHKKHHSHKKAQKIERVPMAKIRNCTLQRKWVPPKTIREVKVCEVMK